MPYAYLTLVSGLCLGLCYLAVVGALAALTGVNGRVDGERAAMLLGLAGISGPLWALHWAWRTPVAASCGAALTARLTRRHRQRAAL